MAWHKSFDAALTAAEDTCKPILVEVSCAGCRYCRQVCEPARDTLRQSLADPRVLELSTFFECARAKAQKAARDQSFQQFRQFRIVASPTVLLLEPDGRSELMRLGGPVTADVLAGSMAVLAELGPALRGVKADPGSGAAHAAIGHVYYRLEKQDRALEHLRRALATPDEFPRRAEAELDAAICELVLDTRAPGAADEAPPWLQGLESFVGAHPDSPRRPEALFYLSTAYLRVGKTTEAEACLSQLIAGELMDSQWAQAGRETLAKAQLPRLRLQLRQRPDDAEINYRMGRALMMTREFHDGLRYLVRALQVDPEDAAGRKVDATLDAAICWCWVDPRMGGPRLRDFLQKHAGAERAPEALYHLATWAYSQGATQQARDAAQRLVGEHPESPWAHKVKGLLQRIQAQGP
jgi:tetratricopeptide (TPR) repeat protein